MNKMVVVYLKACAAKAEELAIKAENGQLWPGDLQRGIGSITQSATDALSAAGSDR